MSGLLTVSNLSIEFNLDGAVIRVVNGVTFRVPQGSSVALVGESGSGKSVMSQAIIGTLPKPASIAGGKILFRDPHQNGMEIDIAAQNPDGKRMQAIRGGSISIIFQEPMTSLSPLHTVGDQISEAVNLHRGTTRAEGMEMCRDMLRLVGFPELAKAAKTYPFELLGGLRQRAMIAMALVCRPALLIADEPTTALDVTIQAQILKLLSDLQQELGMAVLIITHDLGVVANVAKEIVVMYHGRVLEHGTLDHIFRDPGHEHLKALLRAVPRFDMAKGERLVPLREIKSTAGHLLAREEAAEDRADTGLPLIKVGGLSKRFALRKSGLFDAGSEDEITAVDDVSFEVSRGNVLGSSAKAAAARPPSAR